MDYTGNDRVAPALHLHVSLGGEEGGSTDKLALGGGRATMSLVAGIGAAVLSEAGRVAEGRRGVRLAYLKRIYESSRRFLEVESFNTFDSHEIWLTFFDEEGVFLLHQKCLPGQAPSLGTPVIVNRETTKEPGL